MEKERNASTWAKNPVLLAKVNKWEGEAIDKKDKLFEAICELNDNLRNFEELEKAQRKFEVKVEAYRHELADVIEKNSQDEEKMKYKLDVMIKQLSLSIKIRYNLTMESFKEETKKRGPGKYYYQILNIPATLST